MKKLFSLAALVAAFALVCSAQTVTSTGITADRLNKLSVVPSCPTAGYIFYDTSADTVKACNNALSAAAVGTSLPALSDNGTVVTITEVLRMPDGTKTAPSYSFTNGTGDGLYRNASFDYIMALNQRGWWRWTATAFFLNAATGSGNGFGFASGDVDATSQDTFLGRRAAANFRIGAADLNGTPVAQTISVQNAITGTDLPGKQFTLAGSLGTGAALPLPVVIQGADASVATGTTAQTEINRLVVADTKNLTTGAATTVLSIPLATLQMAGGTITFHMEATDGTNQCTRDGSMSFSAENSAGVFVTNVTDAAGALDSTACTSTKSLTEAWAVTSANPALVQVTPTLTGITATRFSINYTVMYGGNTQPTL